MVFSLHQIHSDNSTLNYITCRKMLSFKQPFSKPNTIKRRINYINIKYKCHCFSLPAVSSRLPESPWQSLHFRIILCHELFNTMSVQNRLQSKSPSQSHISVQSTSSPLHNSRPERSLVIVPSLSSISLPPHTGTVLCPYGWRCWRTVCCSTYPRFCKEA